MVVIFTHSGCVENEIYRHTRWMYFHPCFTWHLKKIQKWHGSFRVQLILCTWIKWQWTYLIFKFFCLSVCLSTFTFGLQKLQYSNLVCLVLASSILRWRQCHTPCDTDEGIMDNPTGDLVFQIYGLFMICLSSDWHTAMALCGCFSFKDIGLCCFGLKTVTYLLSKFMHPLLCNTVGNC